MHEQDQGRKAGSGAGRQVYDQGKERRYCIRDRKLQNQGQEGRIRGRNLGTGSGEGRQVHYQGQEGRYRIRYMKEAGTGSGERRQVQDQIQEGR